MAPPAKLLIVDDHQVFAEGLEAVFRAEPDFEPVAAITDPDQVVSAVMKHQPDAVIMDVHLGDVSGIDLTALLTSQPSPPVVVVLTAYSDAATAMSAIEAGAMGFVSKEGPPSTSSPRSGPRCWAGPGSRPACSGWWSRRHAARCPSRSASFSASSPTGSGRYCG